MVFAAVETVTKANPVRQSPGHESDVAAEATAGEAFHAASPLKPGEPRVQAAHYALRSKTRLTTGERSFDRPAPAEKAVNRACVAA
jgi:hypothetical protein